MDETLAPPRQRRAACELLDALQDDMMPIIVATARDYAMTGTDKGIEIIASRLGDEAGITGSAVLARQGLKT